MVKRTYVSRCCAVIGTQDIGHLCELIVNAFFRKLQNETELLTESSHVVKLMWIKISSRKKNNLHLIIALFIVLQEQKSWLFVENLIVAVADYLQVNSTFSAEEAATFYSMYEQNPVKMSLVFVLMSRVLLWF